MLHLVTQFIFCYESPDYLAPIGARNDDITNRAYIESINKYFKRKISYLELGCAGGAIVADLIEEGHEAYGLEGTPYPLQIGRPAWLEHYNTNLFHCDLSKPFQLTDDDGADYQFDVISHWEFLEHLPPSCLHYFCAKMYIHLKDDGAVFCGICPWGASTDIMSLPEGHPDRSQAKHDIYLEDVRIRGLEYHQSCFFRHQWEEKYFSDFFETLDYTLEGCLRDDETSFKCILKKKIGKKYMKLAQKYIEDYEFLFRATVSKNSG